MIVTLSYGHITAYKTRSAYLDSEVQIAKIGDRYTLASQDVYEFYVSGYKYKDKQQSAYIQCVQLFGMLKKYRYTNDTLFLIVGWIQRNAGQYGLYKRLRKEGYYD